MLALDFEEALALRRSTDAVLADRRFEHLDKKADEQVWRLACQAALKPSTDHVRAFVDQHARDPETRTCYFPVEGLAIDKVREVAGATLLPTDHPDVPPEGWGFRLEPPVRGVLAIGVEGTHLGRMSERAALQADHVLRVIRVALRDHRGVHDDQLRFRRDIGFSFGEGLVGWKRAADAIVDVGLDDQLATLVDGSRATSIRYEPRSDIERKASIALRWIERGQLAVDRLESLLYFFFALEALLGDKSEKLKGAGLAFRRAMLSVAVSETFTDPDRVYFLYDRVRSAAVHGEVAPEVDRKTAQQFGWDVREALLQYLEYADAEKLTKRGRLLHALDNHPRCNELREWLREYGGEVWETLLSPD